MKTRWVSWSLIAGFWVVVGVLSGVQFYYTMLEENVPISGQKVFSVQAGQWFLWIPISMMIIWLGQRFPFERKNWTSRLAVHLVASAVVAGVHVGFNSLIIVLTKPFPWRKSYEFSEVFWGRLQSIFDLDFLIYWGVLGVGLAFSYYQKYREGELQAVELQAQLAQAQLQALKMQLHPHFLFNTLNAIAALVRKNENKAATDMLAGLSDLLRLALENVGAQEVSLQRELEFLERYLEIERIRFADRLNVRMRIAPETLDARVPNLILQPLVENAIRHGVAVRATSGVIEICAERHEERLRLQIKDDGPGLPPDKSLSNGVGLSNTMARLQRLYGSAQSLVFDNAPEGGAVVTLEIPFELASVQR
ncbi:histidine kinase [candidate division KSB1 bacterium]|nr:histidine kinase [candidate division KSB1 bacterium]